MARAIRLDERLREPWPVDGQRSSPVLHCSMRVVVGMQIDVHHKLSLRQAVRPNPLDEEPQQARIGVRHLQPTRRLRPLSPIQSYPPNEECVGVTSSGKLSSIRLDARDLRSASPLGVTSDPATRCAPSLDLIPLALCKRHFTAPHRQSGLRHGDDACDLTEREPAGPEPPRQIDAFFPGQPGPSVCCGIQLSRD